MLDTMGAMCYFFVNIYFVGLIKNYKNFNGRHLSIFVFYDEEVLPMVNAEMDEFRGLVMDLFYNPIYFNANTYPFQLSLSKSIGNGLTNFSREQAEREERRKDVFVNFDFIDTDQIADNTLNLVYNVA